MMLRLFYSLLLVALMAGCASRPTGSLPPKHFDFAKDTFSFANELVWVYHRDAASGKFVHEKADPVPDYTHHCFVVARAAKQFFVHAEFKPNYPKVPAQDYAELVRRIRTSDPRRGPGMEKVIIPGYADLKSFSRDHEQLLKGDCGPAWLSYAQRGHWRMIMPFTQDHRDRNAEELVTSVKRNGIAVAHVVAFPALTINHALVVYDSVKTPEGIDFTAYDPNSPDAPVVLHYDSAAHQFSFAENRYFGGGVIDAYEVFHRWNY